MIEWATKRYADNVCNDVSGNERRKAHTACDKCASGGCLTELHEYVKARESYGSAGLILLDVSQKNKWQVTW